MIKAEIRHDMLAVDIISDVFERQSRLFIRQMRGSGRDAEVLAYINRIYKYIADLELEIMDKDVIISGLIKQNKQLSKTLLELPAQRTLYNVRQKRHAGC